jgi:MarR family transcriptional regulator, organic hydroperoxide resistance regulator
MLGDVLDFMRLLWAVDHALQSTSKRMESRLGVTGPQRLVIRIVGRSPGISAGELADIMHVHPSTLTGVLKRLENRGVLTRKPDPADARRALFGLTAKGKELDQQRTGTVEAAVRRALARIEPNQLATTATALGILASELEKDQ